MLQESYIIISGRKRKALKVTCLQCDREFFKQIYYVNKSPNHFCTRECSYAYKRRNQVKIKCKFCDIEFSRTKSKLDKSVHGIYFCSRECRDKGQRIESNNPQLWPSHYSDGKYVDYRKLAFSELKNCCNKCESTIALVVHHKDRNRANNVLSNLEILCSNCHYLEHHASLG